MTITERLTALVDAIAAKIKAETAVMSVAIKASEDKIDTFEETIGDFKVAITDLTLQLANAEQTIKVLADAEVGDLAGQLNASFGITDPANVASGTAALAAVSLAVLVPAPSFSGGNASA